MKKPVFEGILQVCVVVRDIQKAVRTWEDIYGIGPWEIVRLTEKNAVRRKIHGVETDEPTESIVAMSQIGNTFLEIIQPVSLNSVYSEFLETFGEGIHHLAVKHTDDFISLMQERGIEELSSAWINGERFCAYYNTKEDLGFISEIF